VACATPQSIEYAGSALSTSIADGPPCGVTRDPFSDVQESPRVAAIGSTSRSSQFVLSDVQVIQDYSSQSCTLDFRVSNTLPVDVQINRLTLEVVDVHEGARVMGVLEFSAIYDLDVYSWDEIRQRKP
jgi:hypothetical protein